MIIDEVQQTLVISYLTKQVVNFLKRSPWFPWITEHTSVASRMAAAACTFAATLGIMVSCAGRAAGGWECLITTPSLEQITTFVIRWFFNLSAADIQYEIGARRKAVEVRPE